MGIKMYFALHTIKENFEAKDGVPIIQQYLAHNSIEKGYMIIFMLQYWSIGSIGFVYTEQIGSIHGES